MKLFRSLVRLLAVIAGAIVGLGLFLVAVLAFVVFLLVRLLTGRKPDLQFRVNPGPAARSRLARWWTWKPARCATRPTPHRSPCARLTGAELLQLDRPVPGMG